MDVHKNARSCPASRALLFKRISEQEWSVREASEAAGMSDRRARELIRRGNRNEPLTDRSSTDTRAVRVLKDEVSHPASPSSTCSSPGRNASMSAATSAA